MPVHNIYPTDDAYVWDYYPNANYGDEPSLRVGTGQPFTSVLRSYVAFQIMDSPGTPSTLLQAILQIYIDNLWVGSSNTFYLDEVAIFDEDTVTWNTKPAILQTILSRSPTGLVWGGNPFDVTSLIQTLGYGAIVRFGFRLYPEPHTIAAQPTRFWARSKEHASVPPPILQLTFLDNPPATSIITVTPQTGDKEKNTVSWTANADPDFQKYEIMRRQDGGSWDSVHEEFGQATLSWDDPADLADGSTYEYMVRTWDGYQYAEGNIDSMTKPSVIDYLFDITTPAVSETVTATIVGTGGTVDGWWFDFGDGTSLWTSPPSDTETHDYLLAGNYYPKARVKNSGGWYSSIYDFIGFINVQSEDPVPHLVCMPDHAVTGEEVVFNGSGSFDPDFNGGIETYEFDPGTGSFSINNGLNPKYYHTFTSPGTYTIRVRVTDTDSVTAIAEYTVIVIDPVVTDLVLNCPAVSTDRGKKLNYSEEGFYKADGVDMRKTSSGALIMDIGQTCSCIAGAGDIALLEGIRDSDVPDMVRINVDGKDFEGYIYDIMIIKLPGTAADSVWQWKAKLKIPKAPGA